MTKARADIFVQEAKDCGLPIIPYKAGFFISVPAKNPDAIAEKLHEEHIYIVPLAAGLRVAVCSIPLKQMPGLAAKIYQAWKAIEG
jgi:aromatic-amino-acid transaminase